LQFDFNREMSFVFVLSTILIPRSGIGNLLGPVKN